MSTSGSHVLEAVRVRVPDVAQALPLYRDLLGGVEVGPGALVWPSGVRIELQPAGGQPCGLAAVRFTGPALDAATADAFAEVCGGPLVEVGPPEPGAGSPPAPGPVGLARIVDFDHACFAVADLRAANALFRDALGAVPVMGGDNPQGMRAVQLRVPGPAGPSKIELVTPYVPDAFLARYLARSGPGLHHLTFMVEDVAAAAEAAPAAGFAVTGTDLSDPDWRETFVRPAAAFGALLQCADTVKPKGQPLPAEVVEEILEGRWIVARNVMSRKEPAR